MIRNSYKEEEARGSRAFLDLMSMMKIKPLLCVRLKRARLRVKARIRAGTSREHVSQLRARTTFRSGVCISYLVDRRRVSRTSRVVCFFVTVVERHNSRNAFFRGRFSRRASSLSSVLSCSVPSEDLPPNVARTMRPVHPRGRAPLPRARTSRTHVHRPSARGARRAGDDDPRRARRGRRLGSARPARLKLRGRRRAQGDRSRARDPKPRGDSRETRVVPEFVRGRRRVLGFIADARPRRSIGRRGRGRRRRDSRSPCAVKKRPERASCESSASTTTTSMEKPKTKRRRRLLPHLHGPDTTGRRRVFLARTPRTPRSSATAFARPARLHLGSWRAGTCTSRARVAYVAKRASADLTCEICLETMENLRSLRDRRVEARRRASRARLAFLALNGASAEDIRRERRRIERRRRRRRRQHDEAFRRRVATRERTRSGGKQESVRVGPVDTHQAADRCGVGTCFRKRPSRFLFCHSFSRTETPVSIDFIPSAFRAFV